MGLFLELSSSLVFRFSFYPLFCAFRVILNIEYSDF